MPVVVLTFGGTYTYPRLALPGPGGMDFSPPVSTKLACYASSFCIFCYSFLFFCPDIIPPGPGFWKLNVSTLEEDEYGALVSSFWRNWWCCKILVVYHLQQFSGNSAWKVNGTRLFRSFQWKISMSNGRWLWLCSWHKRRSVF